MVSVNDIKKFVSNDFDNATLSGTIKDDKLDLRIYLKGGSKISYDADDYKEKLQLIKEILIELKSYFIKEEESKQLILGGIYGRINNGKISKFM